jgi:hypothetical protein
LTLTAIVRFLLEMRPINQIGDTMADELRMGFAQLLRKARMEHNADFLKEGVRVLSQALMEMEVEEHIRSGTPRAGGRTQQPPQRLPGEELGHPSWKR